MAMKLIGACVLLACAALSHAQEDSTWEPGDYGKETCQLQQDIVKFTVERVERRCGECATYRVCLQLHDLPDGAIMKTCVKDSEVCDPPPFSSYLGHDWSKTSPTGVAKGRDWKDPFDDPTLAGFQQCQTVSAGKTADFSLVDGFRCLPTNLTKWKDEAYILGLEVPNESGIPQPVGVECHSRPTWVSMLGNDPFGSCCTCTLAKAECIWRVRVPECPPDPSPQECSCPDTASQVCKDERQQFVLGGATLSADLLKCADPEATAALINSRCLQLGYGPCNCQVSTVPSCNTIHCDTFVPEQVYHDLLFGCSPSPQH